MLRTLLTPGDSYRLRLIGICIVIFLAATPFATMRVDWSSVAPSFLCSIAILCIGLGYRATGRDESIAAAAMAAGQIAVFANVVLLDNYLALELRRPLVDEFLARVDAALGLDWWSYVNLVKSPRSLGELLTLAYSSSQIQIVGALLFLGFTGRHERLERFALAFILSAMATITIWSVFPSFGALPLHYARGLADPTFHLAMGKEEALAFFSLHATPPTLLRMENVTGLIGCPSFHTAMAILTVYAFWLTPRLGWLSAAWNTLVLISVPADGGHHFIDVAAGAAVAVTSLRVADLALWRSAPLVAPLAELGSRLRGGVAATNF
jgi:membrane-associated phospholipid phosphatase